MMEQDKAFGVTEWVTERVTEQEYKVIELLKTNPQYKTSELVELLGVSKKTVSKHLKALKDKGIIERVGSDRKGYWNLLT